MCPDWNRTCNLSFGSQDDAQPTELPSQDILMLVITVYSSNIHVMKCFLLPETICRNSEPLGPPPLSLGSFLLIVNFTPLESRLLSQLREVCLLLGSHRALRSPNATSHCDVSPHVSVLGWPAAAAELSTSAAQNWPPTNTC